MPKLFLPLVALLAIGGSAAGASVYLLTRDEAVEEVLPPAVQATATPTPSPTSAPAATTTPMATPPPDGLTAYQDEEFGFRVDYSADWSVSEVAVDPQVEDLLKGIEFTGKGGVARASVFVYQNPSDLSLEDWVMKHDVIFFDRPPERTAIGGVPALLARLNFAGQQSPLAYVKIGSLVFGVKGLTDADYNDLAEGLRFVQQ